MTPDPTQSRSENVTQVEVERLDPQAESAGATGLARVVWIGVAVMSGIYIFVPEPSDVIPIIGWLDEGTAAALLTTALTKLGIRIPVIDYFLRRRSRSSKSAKSNG